MATVWWQSGNICSYWGYSFPAFPPHMLQLAEEVMSREYSQPPVLVINLITIVNTGIIGDGLRLPACVCGAAGEECSAL